MIIGTIATMLYIQLYTLDLFESVFNTEGLYNGCSMLFLVCITAKMMLFYVFQS
jgi:hypothetical protein